MGDNRTETALRQRARRLIVNTIDGTDLFTVEVSGQDEDIILTTDYAKYLQQTLNALLGPCEDM